MTTGRWMRSAAGIAVVAALAITALGAPAGAAQGGVTVKPDVTYRTVDGEPLALDVYQPAKKGQNQPAVVVVHGGGWSAGDKSLFAQQSNQLAERGFVAFSINYRLAPAHPYPAAVDDVEAAVAWVRKHAKEYGVDPKRIGALGGSAGGHLVGMLATNGEGSLKTGHRVAAVVSWSGPMDFVSLAPAAATNAGASFATFLGCLPDACSNTYAAASPVTHVDKTDSPMLIVNSTMELVPKSQADTMKAALDKAGVANQAIILPGTRHSRGVLGRRLEPDRHVSGELPEEIERAPWPRGAATVQDVAAEDEPTLSVTELNTTIRDALRGAIPENVWVRGEVQGFRESRAGHVYFQLVEKDERRNRVQAALDVALFRSHLMTVHAALRKVPGVELADDVEVRVKGHIDVYPPTGRLQLIMTGIDPVFTAGALAANRDRVLRQLEAEGLLRANAVHELPEVPLRIGLVTSAASAAYHDFLDELDASGFAFRVGVCDVRVQGANAPRRVVWALRRLARIAPALDAVVLVRGGGSRADLAPFDSDDVARAIAAMPIPVLTGIGHEIDRSVADEVAHTASKTPTASAQVLVERVMEFVYRLDDVSRGVVHNARSNCALALRELRDSARRARRGPRTALARELAAVERHRVRAEELGTRTVKQAIATLDGSERTLSSAGGRLVRAEGRRLDASAARLRALDPTRVLERGYTITRDRDGQVVKRAAPLSTGDRLLTEFADGTAASVVQDVDKREP